MPIHPDFLNISEQTVLVGLRNSVVFIIYLIFLTSRPPYVSCFKVDEPKLSATQLAACSPAKAFIGLVLWSILAVGGFLPFEHKVFISVASSHVALVTKGRAWSFYCIESPVLGQASRPLHFF